jgi:hypothetical protein
MAYRKIAAIFKEVLNRVPKFVSVHGRSLLKMARPYGTSSGLSLSLTQSRSSFATGSGTGYSPSA